MTEPPAEAEVLRPWARGEMSPEEAFVRLYAAYAPIVRAWLALRAGNAADDLFQDVWTVFYRRCREWQHREPPGDESRPVLSFLFRTCYLTLRAHRRLQAARGTAPLDEVHHPAIDGQAHAHAVVQFGECLEAARRHCSDDDCAVLTAKLAGLPAREIARTLGITESAVDHRYRNAIERIRLALGHPERGAHV